MTRMTTHNIVHRTWVNMIVPSFYTITTILTILSALFGGYTGYHFYFAPTHVFDKVTHKEIHRAQLIDYMIGDELAKQSGGGH